MQHLPQEPPSTLQALREHTEEVKAAFAAVLQHAEVRYQDINHASDVIFVG